MKVEFTVGRFPVTERVKDACGLPFSCVLQPLGHNDKLTADSPTLSVLARCRSCYAYINSFCSLDEHGFICSLCGTHTSLSGSSSARYKLQPGLREALPELRSSVYEALCSEPQQDSQGASQEPDFTPEGPLGAPAYVALVDVGGPEDFIELVKGALMAALEALPPAALFGLITFSDRIGLHDLRGSCPMLHCLPVLDQLPVLVPLEDVVPLSSLLLPVWQFKEAIAQALDQLDPEPSLARTRSVSGTSSQHSGAGNGSSAHGPMPVASESMERSCSGHQGQQPCRAFGPALQAAIEYLRGISPPAGKAPASAAGGPAWLGHARLMAFLSGPPDLGPGKTVPVPQEERPGLRGRKPREAPPPLDDALAIDPRSRSFYEQAAVAAAALGLAIDMYVTSPELVGLQVLEPLCHSTGGALYLYPSVEEAALPQDLYRRLSSPHAVAGLLRVRASRELRAVRCHGRCYSSQQQDALWHVPGCGPGDALVVDLQHATAAGWNSGGASPPTLQIAFQYSVVVPLSLPTSRPASQPPSSPSSSLQAGSVHQPLQESLNRQFVVQRRLRVCTLRFDVANMPRDLYASANADAILTTLVHQVVAATKAEGSGEGRMLVRDWLCTFATDYHKNAHMRAGIAELIQMPVDLTFDSCPSLASLPRLAYALLRTPLLLPAAQRHADLTAYLQHLWTALPPSELSRAIYPSLTSFWDPDHVNVQHALSRGAIMGCEAPIFLLDAYILLLVYYRRESADALPYPPPQPSLLRRIIASIRQERRITPHVEVLKEGAEGADIFHSLLIDDPDEADDDADRVVGLNGDGPAAARQPSPTGLLHFCDHIRAEVVAQLQAEASE